MRSIVVLALSVMLIAGAVSEAAALPDGIKGFQGMMEGTVVSKGESSFVLKVERITKTWKHNKAENPQEAVGKELQMAVTGRVSRLAAKQREVLKSLKPGDRVTVEPFHFGGDRLEVVEELRKLGATVKSASIPTSLRGFQGMMSGRLVKKGSTSFVFKVEKIMKTWKGNRAANPKAAVGETLTLSLGKVTAHHGSRIMRNYQGMEAGDAIELEAFDLGGGTLAVKEWLKKVGDD